MKLLDELRRTQCHTRVFVAWFLVSFALCLIYAIVVYASLAGKNVLPADPGPDYVPFTNIPRHYNVTLRFDSESSHSVPDYSGQMRMSFVVREASQRVFLYAGSGVKIGRCVLFEADRSQIIVNKGVYNPKTEIQTLIPQTNLTTDEDYVLEVEFSGRLDQTGGPQSFTYVSTAGDRRYGVYFSSPKSATKGLRYLFPSLDASTFPSMFDVTVYHRDSLKALSNFVGKSAPAQDYFIDVFTATTRLYPAQLGFVLCDFPYQRQFINNTEVTLYYRANVIQKVNMQRVIQFMDKSSITIGKLDAVVVPGSPTVSLPGLSLMNEAETIAENAAINGLQEKFGQECPSKCVRSPEVRSHFYPNAVCGVNYAYVDD